MRALGWLAVAALCGGCGDDTTGDGGTADLATARDMAKSPDLARALDLAGGPDMSVADAAQAVDSATPDLSADLATPWPDVPDGLRAPDDGGEQLLLWANADGSQIYTCTPPPDGGPGDAGYAWVFTAPAATLYDPAQGTAIGKHFAGPTWQLTQDMSEVVGQTIAKAIVDPMSIPWLLLKAVAHMGAGLFTKVDFVQRVRTQGGIAPKTPCNGGNSGATSQVPYSASYYFYGHP